MRSFLIEKSMRKQSQTVIYNKLIFNFNGRLLLRQKNIQCIYFLCLIGYNCCVYLFIVFYADVMLIPMEQKEEEASNKTQVGMLTCDIDICLCRSNKKGFITVLADGGIDSIADSSNSFVKKKIWLEEQITE